MKTIAARVTETAAASLAAILLLTAGAASAPAQEFKLKGDIPFAFAAGRVAVQAGNYEIAQISYDQSILKLYNPADHKSVFVSVVERIATPGETAPRAEFSCGASGCKLVRVFDRTRGYQIATPRLRSDEKERLVAVNLTPEFRK